jgi:phosphoribosylamine--glycine ligase
LLLRLESDLAKLMLACTEGRISREKLACMGSSALGVVLCARGYPGEYPKGMEIFGLDEVGMDSGVAVFHGGTVHEAGRIFSSGGRVLCVTALGRDLDAARQNVYGALEKIRMTDGFFRRDIGSIAINCLQSREGICR